MPKKQFNKSLKVYVVDDDYTARTLISRYLEDHFCNIEYFKDPNEIPVADDTKLCCDVLVMDVRFGYDRTRGIDWVLEKLKYNQIDKSMLIIFISNFGNTLPEIREKLTKVEQISKYKWFDKPIDLPSMWGLIKDTKGIN